MARKPTAPVSGAPYTSADPSLITAMQQYIDGYQVAFLSNQSAYRNTINNVIAPDSTATLKRAAVIAKYVHEYRGPIPFGAVMARCEKESNFKYDVKEPKTFFNKKTNREEWRYPYPKGSKLLPPQGDGQYGAGAWQFTCAWDVKGAPRAYVNTLEEALDPDVSTRAAMAALKKTHAFLVKYIPGVMEDLVFYTWLLSLSHASGPGRMWRTASKEDAVSYLENPNGFSDKQLKWMYTKSGNGMAGAICRCHRKFGGKVTLGGIVTADARCGSPVYSKAEGVRRLLEAGLKAPYWEGRYDKLLKDDFNGLNSLDLLAQALGKAKSVGQGIAADAFKDQARSFDRSQLEANRTRKDHYRDASGTSIAAKEGRERTVGNAYRTAQASVDFATMPTVSGPVMEFDETTQLWSFRTGAGA